MKTNKKSTPSSLNNNRFSVRVKKDFRLNKSYYLMLLPIIAYYIIFHYVPMYGALIAFKDFKPQLGIMGSNFVGMKHFINFFTSPSFGEILGNTLRISIKSLIFTFTSPIIFALLLNEVRNVRFAKIVQNFTYIPHFISLVVVCGMIKDFTLDTGIITKFLTIFGFEAKSLLNYPEYFDTIYISSSVWQELGWNSIVYLAALTGIDAQLYEAATIDGAGKLRQTINITIPGIMPTIILMFILQIGGILNVGYEKMILLYNDSTMSVADIISTYTYRKGLLDLDWSFSSAVGLFNSVVNCIFLFSANWISRKVNDTGLW